MPTWRKLFVRWLELVRNVDDKAEIRIVRRGPGANPGEMGTVLYEKIVPVSRWHSGRLVVEEADIEAAAWEKS